MMELGVREAIWALVGVLSLYLVVILFRLALPRRARAVVEAAPQTQVVEAPPAAVAAAAEPRPALPEIPLAEMNELEIQQLRRDIGQLRTEQDFLRSELVAMRLDMNEIQGTLARAEVQALQPQAPQQYVRPVSPQHSEAMLLAGRGVTAAQIADHCGISVAEAELVCALARAEDGA
ncbi:DUF2802 domain-containing protein [Thauera aminoaromatica]|uniref:DUF2802 domain-containing protein n=1 Tax=Thauera aminoaromatica TaxID=164330 RepID=A0A5C7TCE1_THASP|nr:DUF2802 domain-containing protein [Thauera aminoaromatica]TXH92651.1 MAG: DUF2802 domain-containing protein [Thauera aminoaromatica]